MSDIIILGAGVIGASIAYHLARDGARVALVDRASPAESPSASWASAGGLRSQGRYTHEHAITCAAAARWRTLSEELDADLEVAHGGHLHLAETEAEEAIVAARVAADRAGGVDIELLRGDALRAVAPHVTKRARAGAFTRGDGQAHPGRTAQAFARCAAGRGAKTFFGALARPHVAGGRIDGVIFDDGRLLQGDQVVVAAGAWSAPLLDALGVSLPLRWRGLQMLLSEIAPPLLAPTVTAVGRNLSLKQSRAGQFMVGGRWWARPAGVAPEVAPVDVHIARQWSSAVTIMPAMATLRLAQSWAGAEAQSVDGSPFIGRAPIEGLYIATGFSNHGFQISPAIGELVARDLLRGTEPLLASFALARAATFSPDAIAAFAGESIQL